MLSNMDDFLTLLIGAEGERFRQEKLGKGDHTGASSIKQGLGSH